MAVIRTNLGLCGSCEEGKECSCTVDMTVCDKCKMGPLNDSETLCAGDHCRLEELCPQCGGYKEKDETGEFRCKPCDIEAEGMIRDQWEEAVSQGEEWALDWGDENDS